MKPKLIGTIYATASDLAKFDAIADSQKARRESTSSTKDMAALKRRVVDGETRWYDGANAFAIINRAGRRLWFDIKGDKTFARA